MKRSLLSLLLAAMLSTVSAGYCLAACAGGTEKVCSVAIREPRGAKGDVKDALSALEKAQKSGDAAAIAAKAAAVMDAVLKYQEKSTATRATLTAALEKADDGSAANVAKDFLNKLNAFDADVAEAKAKAEPLVVR